MSAPVTAGRARIIEESLLTPPPYALIPAPADVVAWADWLSTGARRLIEAVRAGGPERPVWSWQSDNTPAFWLRKMLHDEVIHRVDAERAAGRHSVIAPDLAAEGVSDLLATIGTLSDPHGPTPSSPTWPAPGADSFWWLTTRARPPACGASNAHRAASGADSGGRGQT
jgi:uncharacterized protein (TIGR03083 family)